MGMAIYGHNMIDCRRGFGEMAKGNACHIYLKTEQGLILDAIGKAMGKRRLGVEASRSQLISTAVRNFIEDCTAEEDLREVVVEIRKRLSTVQERADQQS